MKDDKLGPTGELPRGKLDDDGALNCAISHENGCVRVDFWLAMPPDLALEFAFMITKHAMDLKRGET